MANTIRDYSATAASNTVVDGADISEGCSPAGINDAIRGVMADLKDVSTGAVALESPAADSLSVTGNVSAATFSGDGSSLTGIPTPTLTSLGIPNHDQVTVDGSGNVGIGGSPATNLHIQQTGNAGNNYKQGSIKIGSTYGVEIGYNGLSSGRASFTSLNNAGTTNNRMSFGFGAITSGGEPTTNVMTLNQAGDVGIGTSNPAGNKLTVEGGANGSGVYQRLKHTGSAGQNNTAIFNISTASNTNSMEVNEQYNYSAFRHYGNLVNHYSDVDNHHFRTKGGTTKMTIDSSGRVTMPYQPAWGARSLSNATSSGGTSNANEILKFSSIIVNTGNHYNSSTGVFTCPVAGRYFVTFSGLYDDSYNNTGAVYIRHNGSEKYRGYHQNSGSYYEQISMSGVIDAAANDTIDIYSVIAGWHIGGETSWSGFLIG